MAEPVLSAHAKEMLGERDILEEWIWQTIQSPDNVETGDNGNVHYTKAIEKNQGRALRVIVNEESEPHRIVTVFFDRRLRRKA